MKINFKLLKINNFMSFKEAELNLDRTGYFIIKGNNKNINDSATSNGSGKSTIFEALCWVLTGETIRGTKEVSNIYCDKGACVELTFYIDNNFYKIIRKKDPSNLFLFVNDEDKSGKGIRDTEQILRQYLPDLSSLLISSVIILGQGLPQRFTNNSPSGRKEILETLSKSDFMIYDLKYKVSNRKNYLSEKIREIEDKNLINTTNKTHVLNIINDYENKISKLNVVDNIETVLKNLQAEIETQSKELKTCQFEINNLTTQNLKLNQEYVENQNTISNIKFNIYQKYKDLEETIKFKIVELDLNIKNTQTEIDNINAIKDVCPTCGQKIVGIVKPDTSSLLEKLNDFKNQKIEQNNKYNQLLEIEKTEIKNDTDSFTEKNITLKESIDKIKLDLQNNKNIEKTLIDKLNDLKIEVVKYQNILSDRETLLKEYTDEINKNKNILFEIESQILYNNNEYETLSDRLTLINKIYSALNKEFRGYLLTNIINYIDKVSKEYCKQVFNNTNLNFCLKGNNISISYCNKEYENLSGGEKQKIDIIIQFAIRNMLNKYLNFSSNILVLDEITDFLDQQGIDSILKLISENLKDTPAIYFITHHENLAFPYDGEILITKNNEGFSSLVSK